MSSTMLPLAKRALRSVSQGKRHARAGEDRRSAERRSASLTDDVLHRHGDPAHQVARRGVRRAIHHVAGLNRATRRAPQSVRQSVERAGAERAIGIDDHDDVAGRGRELPYAEIQGKAFAAIGGVISLGDEAPQAFARWAVPSVQLSATTRTRSAGRSCDCTLSSVAASTDASLCAGIKTSMRGRTPRHRAARQKGRRAFEQDDDDRRRRQAGEREEQRRYPGVDHDVRQFERFAARLNGDES